MPELHYSADLHSAFVETRAFKFADQSQLLFQCEVSLCELAGSTADASALSCAGITVFM
jgi:hypothetical protein